MSQADQETGLGAHITHLIAQIAELEAELEAIMARRAAQLRMTFVNGRVQFEQDILRRHRELQSSLWAYLRSARILVMITAPFIYALIVPLLLLDLFISVYQMICFPVYGIPKLQRRDYFAFDLAHLGYLNLIEKINCAFCSYANGLIAYAMEIASLTEAYWCPIKHARRLHLTHARYRDFLDYGDAEGFKTTSARVEGLPKK